MAKATDATVFKPAVLLDAAGIDKAIKSIHGRAKTLQTDMHLVCCSILEHLLQHRDARMVDKVVTAFTDKMPKGQRINAIKQWFELYAPITYHKNKPTFDAAKLTSGDVIMRSGMNTPFWQLKGEEGVEYQAMDVPAAVQGLISKLNKDMQKAGTNHAELVHVLTLYLKLEDEKAEPSPATQPVLLLEHVA